MMAIVQVTIILLDGRMIWYLSQIQIHIRFHGPAFQKDYRFITVWCLPWYYFCCKLLWSRATLQNWIWSGLCCQCVVSWLKAVQTQLGFVQVVNLIMKSILTLRLAAQFIPQSWRNATLIVFALQTQHDLRTFSMLYNIGKRTEHSLQKTNCVEAAGLTAVTWSQSLQ